MDRNHVLNALGLPSQVETRATNVGGTAWTWLYLRGGEYLLQMWTVWRSCEDRR